MVKKLIIGIVLSIIAVALLLFIYIQYQKATEPDAEELQGQRLPSFSLHDLDGNLIRSQDFLGKPLVVNFWFTTCKPCLIEIPTLNTVKERYGGEVTFLAVTFNDPVTVKDFLDKMQFTWTILPSAEGYIDREISSFPTTFFVDRSGVIQHVQKVLPCPAPVLK